MLQYELRHKRAGEGIEATVEGYHRAKEKR